MLRNMKIWIRFVLGFSLILALLIALVLVNLHQIKTLQAAFDRIISINNVRLKLVNNMVNHTREASINMNNILLLRDSEKTLEMKIKIDSIRNQFDTEFKKFEDLVTTDDTTAYKLIIRIKSSRDASRKINNEVIDLAMAGKYNEAMIIMNRQASMEARVWILDINDLISHNEASSAMFYLRAKKAQSEARSSMFILCSVAIALSVLISVILTVSITQPLKIAQNLVLSRDLSIDLSAYQKGGGELGLMILSFSKEISERKRQEQELSTYRDQLEDMVRQRTSELSNVIKEVKETVNILVSSSNQILAATTQVAAGTSETATAISETTTTVEEVQQAAKQSAEKAKNVAESAQLVVKVSHDGQKAVEETVNGMNRIHEQMDIIAQTVVRLSEQSQSIGDIIASVTDIADQSNLLAVNAAIEAAKAGEQGKGFTVVAQEIKNLAGQSKQATLQVRTILNDIQKATGAAVMAIEQGSKAVKAGEEQSVQAGDAIRILAESSYDAVQATTQIVASSQQQVVGMDQISVAMQNINQAGTEIAVSMVQFEKSAKNLNELGQKLKEMVEGFNV